MGVRGWGGVQWRLVSILQPFNSFTASCVLLAKTQKYFTPTTTCTSADVTFIMDISLGRQTHETRNIILKNSKINVTQNWRQNWTFYKCPGRGWWPSVGLLSASSDSWRRIPPVPCSWIGAWACSPSHTRACGTRRTVGQEMTLHINSTWDTSHLSSRKWTTYTVGNMRRTKIARVSCLIYHTGSCCHSPLLVRVRYGLVGLSIQVDTPGTKDRAAVRLHSGIELKQKNQDINT